MPDTSWTRTNTFLDTAGQKSQFFLKERVVFAKGECCLEVTTQGWTLQHLIVKRSCVRIFRGLWPASVFDSVRIFTSSYLCSHLADQARLLRLCPGRHSSLSLAISLSSSTKFFFPVRPNSSFVVPLRSPIPFCNFSIYFLCSLCFIHFLLTFSIFFFQIFYLIL